MNTHTTTLPFDLLEAVRQFGSSLSNWNLKYDVFPSYDDFYKTHGLSDELKGLVKSYFNECCRQRSQSYWGCSSDNNKYMAFNYVRNFLLYGDKDPQVQTLEEIDHYRPKTQEVDEITDLNDWDFTDHQLIFDELDF